MARKFFKTRIVEIDQGSRKRLRFVKGRDEPYAMFWVFVAAAVGFLFATAIALLQP